MAATSDAADLEQADELDLTADLLTLPERIKKELARVRRLAMMRRKLILEELAAIEGEYNLPRTKPARHKEH